MSAFLQRQKKILKNELESDKKEFGEEDLLFHFASFFKFMHAKVSVTCIVTFARPRSCVKRKPCFTASEYSPYPLAATALATAGIPTVHEEEGLCCALFGEAARHIDVEKLKNGAILDAVAAEILREHGIDTGLRGELHFESETVLALRSPEPAERAAVHLGEGRLASVKTEKSCRVRLYADSGAGEIPFAYTYQNANGQKFLVFLYDSSALPRISGLHRGYLIQNLLHESAEWIADRKLPAFCGGNPGLYCLCKEGEGSLSAGLFNCFADSVLNPEIRLWKNYRSIEFLNCSGTLCGDRVVLDAPIGAFDFIAFEVME